MYLIFLMLVGLEFAASEWLVSYLGLWYASIVHICLFMCGVLYAVGRYFYVAYCSKWVLPYTSVTYASILVLTSYVTYGFVLLVNLPFWHAIVYFLAVGCSVVVLLGVLYVACWAISEVLCRLIEDKSTE